jgi:hypothetical protein
MRDPVFITAAFPAIATWVNWDLAGDFVLAAAAIVFAILFIGWTLQRMSRGSRSYLDRRH